MTTTRPSQVRERILREHAGLRARLSGLEDAATALRAGDPDAVVRALDLARDFYRELRNHIDLEDDLLAPTLREADAWGPVRCEQLLAHHAAQRQELRELSERSHQGQDPRALAEMLTKLVADLREDMTHEERDLLTPELLRDGPVTVEGGEDG